MAKAHREHIVGIFLVSCCALILLIVSLATKNWVVSDLKANESENNKVNYGIFEGIYERKEFKFFKKYDIKITCDFKENKCIMSCKDSAEDRKKELQQLLNGEQVQFSCLSKVAVFQVDQNYKIDPKNIYMNAGLWVSTILFLVLTLLLAFISAVLGIVNICSNPYKTIFSLPGIVIFNMAAIVVNIMTIILWGAHFGAYIVHNVALLETLNGEFSSDGMASLGYSYWMLFSTIPFFGVNIFLVYHREYMLNKQPSAESIAVEQNTDGIIFLY